MTALFAAVFQAAAEGGIVDQFAESDFADFDLVIARFANVAAEAHDAGAGVVGAAEFGVFRSAQGDDVFDGAERFHVVHDRRAHIEAEHRRASRHGCRCKRGARHWRSRK